MDVLKGMQQLRCRNPFAEVLVRAAQHGVPSDSRKEYVIIREPDQNRSRTKSSGQLKSAHPPDVVSTSARGTRAQEVARLESLCETRTKELNYSKMQLKAGLQAFDAMACLLNYCTNQLDAFSCPEVTAKLKDAEGHISEQQQQIENLQQQKTSVEQQLTEVTQARDAALEDVAKLQQEMKEAEEAHLTSVQQLKDTHAAALTSQQEELHSQQQQTAQQMQKYHEKQLEYTQQSHQRQISEMTAEHQMATNRLKVAHLEEIQELRNRHDKQMEELHAQHRNKLEDITRRFESIKLSLSEKVESLCVECDDLRVRARTSEEALQRDADVKVQLALTPYLHLPKEIESLRTVIDMRTEEIQKLRRQNMDLEKQLEELPIAQEKVASLQQKVENLQAIINIKTDHEKQLHEKCQVLMRKYDRESRANKRLSMDYEQVVWRMSQSADFSGCGDVLTHPLPHSPPRGGDHLAHGSPSPVRRSLSNNAQGDGAGVMRRQRKTSGGDEDFDRKIRCRSATFVMEKAKAVQGKNGTGVNGAGSAPESVSGSPSKQPLSRSADYAEEIAAALSTSHDESWSSGHYSADPSDLQSSMESSIMLDTSKDFFETPRGVSYSVIVESNGTNGEKGAHEDVFEAAENDQTTVADESTGSMDVSCKANVTVVVNSPGSD
ncbi:hypothetical protein BaRGS_00008136 [Batillaria attramentaria]|uniref:Uncharacterized protein n=1 Tax=Batillaria attramentaria TaxID=370345 RepID=A0ABD0LLY1_9CAEN